MTDTTIRRIVWYALLTALFTPPPNETTNGTITSPSLFQSSTASPSFAAQAYGSQPVAASLKIPSDCQRIP